MCGRLGARWVKGGGAAWVQGWRPEAPSRRRIPNTQSQMPNPQSSIRKVEGRCFRRFGRTQRPAPAFTPSASALRVPGDRAGHTDDTRSPARSDASPRAPTTTPALTESSADTDTACGSTPQPRTPSPYAPLISSIPLPMTQPPTSGHLPTPHPIPPPIAKPKSA